MCPPSRNIFRARPRRSGRKNSRLEPPSLVVAPRGSLPNEAGHDEQQSEGRDQHDDPHDPGPPREMPPARADGPSPRGRSRAPGHGRLPRGAPRPRCPALGLHHGGIAASLKIAVQTRMPSPLGATTFRVPRLARPPTVAPPLVRLDLDDVGGSGARPGHQVPAQSGALPRHDVENPPHRSNPGRRRYRGTELSATGSSSPRRRTEISARCCMRASSAFRSRV